ncbi:MAG: hypothetical protein PUA52_01940 [Lachnospiraceae bacterium]|nr:hypothetical protein [Lachnospiraceae bacterium]
MAFAERFENDMQAAGEEALLAILNGGFAFDYKIPYQNCGIRRMGDTLTGDGLLETRYFCFPQNGQKDKLKVGVTMTVVSEVEDSTAKTVVFRRPRLTAVERASMQEVYYAVAAVKGGRLIEKDGHNTYLHHDVMLLTPEKETVTLEGFDFASHELFMLGLFGGDYKVGIKEKA